MKMASKLAELEACTITLLPERRFKLWPRQVASQFSTFHKQSICQWRLHWEHNIRCFNIVFAAEGHLMARSVTLVYNTMVEGLGLAAGQPIDTHLGSPLCR